MHPHVFERIAFKWGTLAARPAFGNLDFYYYATDTKALYWDTGLAWQEIAGGGIAPGFPVNIVVSSATALTVEKAAGTNYAFQVDTSGTQGTGIKITAAAAAAGAFLDVLSSGTDEDLFIQPKGAGSVWIGKNGAWPVVIQPSLVQVSPAAMAGGNTTLEIDPPDHTAVIAETQTLQINANTLAITGAYATQRFGYFLTPIITAAVPLTIATATTFEIQSAPTVAGAAAVTSIYGLNISGGAINIANIAGTSYRALRTGAHTVTLTTATAMTGTPSIAALALNIITIDQSGGAVTVTEAATMYIAGAPTVAAGVTLTRGYAIHVAGGITRLDASLQFGLPTAATPFTITVGAQQTAATAGGALTLAAGAGNTSGAGGGLTINSGAGGSSGNSGFLLIQPGSVAAGNGGAFNLTGANGVGGNNTGSTITITAGDSVGSGQGGSVNLYSGNGAGGVNGAAAGTFALIGAVGGSATTGTAGDGANIAFSAGAGGAASGASGIGGSAGGLTIGLGAGGNAGTGNAAGGHAGLLTIGALTGGNGIGTGGGGYGSSFIFIGGLGGGTTTGIAASGGTFGVTTGNGGAATGAGTSGPGGLISFLTGNGANGNGAIAPGASGAITLTTGAAGTGGSGNASSGAITIQSGAKSGTGVGGSFVVNTNGATARLTITGAATPSSTFTTTMFFSGLSAAGAGTALVISGGNEMYPLASGRQYKDDITDLLDTSRVFNLIPRSFVWNERTATPGVADVGLIADEVADAFPELVNFVNGVPVSIKYERVVLPLLTEVRQLRERIAVLER